jgi:hypothetical protein
VNETIFIETQKYYQKTKNFKTDLKSDERKLLEKLYCPARWILLKLGSFERPLLNREALGFLKNPPVQHPVRAQQRFCFT